jgi:dTDP-4-amino-4,6-dideoxygalactose transaminase
MVTTTPEILESLAKKARTCAAVDEIIKATSGQKTRTILTKDIKTADPISQEGIDAAVAVMASGKLYRYNVKEAAESPVSLVEVELAKYTGHKYCVALNSCGSALYLMLLAAGVKPGDIVLTNAFTFVAVPSAVHHAGAKCVYVETAPNYTMDLEDLKLKIAESGAKHLMISHMRGKVADMDEMKRICDERGVMLLEDCAHSLGVRFGDGTAASPHSGKHGVACCISSQSYKMLNSGEGGFFLTDDGQMAAKVAVYAGAYEGLSAKHLSVPSKEEFGDLPYELPNYSQRMNSVSAAMLRPQIRTLEERVLKYNERYHKVEKSLSAHPKVFVPKQHEKVRICGDSIQFTLVGDVSDSQVKQLLKECIDHGLIVELFGAAANARNFVNWKFSPAGQPLPKTAAIISRTIDIRLPLTWADEDFDTLCKVMEESLDAVFGE